MIEDRLRKTYENVQRSTPPPDMVDLPSRYGCFECKEALFIRLKKDHPPMLFCPFCDCVYDNCEKEIAVELDRLQKIYDK